MNRSQLLLVAIIVVLALGLGHSVLRAPASTVLSVPEHRDYDPMTSRPNDEGDSGARSYVRYCAGCHGVEGDGNGPAATQLDPKPRDFTKGIYKFTSTEQGTAPLEDDILRTITHGLEGTSMPSWKLLPENERRSLTRYIMRFFKGWKEEYGPPLAIPFHRQPYDFEDPDDLEAAIAEGETVYHEKTTCWSCHPGYLDEKKVEELIGRPPGTDYAPAVAKPDVWGAAIKPPDFRSDRMKSVRNLDDLYTVITAGVRGTAMPSWSSALTAEQLWSLTIYVDSLRPDSIVRRTIDRIRKQWEEEEEEAAFSEDDESESDEEEEE